MKDRILRTLNGTAVAEYEDKKDYCNPIISEKKRKKLLLHSCCAPCSTATIERLINDYEITIFFYNPNITEKEEYEKRYKEQIKVVEYFENIEKRKIPCIDGNYNAKQFYEECEKYANSPEGGERCRECYRMRLEKTADYALFNEFDFFTTTLTISPHKNSEIINNLGKLAGAKRGVVFLEKNLKKMGGYQRSIEMAKKMHLYRQNYCGCSFSKEK